MFIHICRQVHVQVCVQGTWPCYCHCRKAAAYAWPWEHAQAVVANGEWQNCDEIKAYLEGRYVSASKASWRLFSFRMHYGTLSITRLPCMSLECIRSCTMIMPVFLKLLIASKTRKQRPPNISKPILITPWPEKSRTWIFPPCLHGPMGRKNGPSGREGVVSGTFISSVLPLVNGISYVHY